MTVCRFLQFGELPLSKVVFKFVDFFLNLVHIFKKFSIDKISMSLNI